MGAVKTFRDLDAWQAAMEVGEACYRVTSAFPSAEQYGLSAQMRRAAVSAASNIAEGHQLTRPGYVHHLQIALGSLAELETQLELALRLEYVDTNAAKALQESVDRTGQVLHGLLRSLRS